MSCIKPSYATCVKLCALAMPLLTTVWKRLMATAASSHTEGSNMSSHWPRKVRKTTPREGGNAKLSCSNESHHCTVPTIQKAKLNPQVGYSGTGPAAKPSKRSLQSSYCTSRCLICLTHCLHAASRSFRVDSCHKLSRRELYLHTTTQQYEFGAWAHLCLLHMYAGTAW